MSVSLPRISFLGAGSMGGAILSGLLAKNLTSEVLVTNRSVERAATISGDGVESIALANEPEGNLRAVRDARVVVVGVKPQGVADLLREIAPELSPGTLVVSVAAGVTIASMEALLPESVAVARSMPNTPSTVGLGVTGLAFGDRVDAQQREYAVTIFEAVGEVLVVDEAQINPLSAYSGSGPAYVFFFIEQFVDSAIRNGFSKEDALTMVAGTFRGASELLAASDADPAELRRRVTSPKGTTERAIEVFANGGLPELIDEAVAAAVARAEAIAATPN
ncbi:pyrroline-5-carboxylate reductase [Humidisolicoccus flavus]|uniref:pyrroline-5-carboxylate reductase n=1 Tax=Humidisolicoccus flavus TaxID=3111414 RepID=UPI00324805F5